MKKGCFPFTRLANRFASSRLSLQAGRTVGYSAAAGSTVHYNQTSARGNMKETKIPTRRKYVQRTHTGYEFRVVSVLFRYCRFINKQIY
jgi:hypothetical protein